MADEVVKASPESLIKRLRENRKCKVAVGKFTFFCRRPSDKEFADWYRAGRREAEIYLYNVIGWEGVTENDVIGGGGSDHISFDIDLWHEWASDRPDFWEPIVKCVLGAYREHEKDMEAAEKK